MQTEANGNATPLAPNERQFMEAAFEQDFTDVRIVARPHFSNSSDKHKSNLLVL